MLPSSLVVAKLMGTGVVPVPGMMMSPYQRASTLLLSPPRRIQIVIGVAHGIREPMGAALISGKSMGPRSVAVTAGV